VIAIGCRALDHATDVSHDARGREADEEGGRKKGGDTRGWRQGEGGRTEAAADVLVISVRNLSYVITTQSALLGRFVTTSTDSLFMLGALLAA
jgi:hypothetical protein